MRDIEKIKADMLRIWKICHIPTSAHLRAYTHFQRDFDEIRAICVTHITTEPRK